MKKNKVKHFNTKMKKKLMVTFIMIMIATIFVLGHTLYISVANGKDFNLLVLSQQDSTSKVLPYKRGEIMDRNGNVLATSTKVYNLILDPYIILKDKKNLEPTVDALVSNFGLDKNELISVIHEKAKSRYVVQTKGLTFEQIEPFKKLQNDTDKNPNIQGVWFEDEYVRNYPYSTLAASTLGYTDKGNAGAWGIEENYNDYLNGTNGREYGFVNEENTMEKIVKKAVDGDSIISTIDMNVQQIIETKIQSWVDQYHPQNVAVVVTDPTNGEILGMSSSKNVFDLNNPRDLSRYYTPEQIAAMSDDESVNNMSQIWRNYCISDTYEAGSTIKPFTVAAALEEGVVSKDQTFVCDGVQNVGGWNIHCHKRSGHGILNLTQAIMFSCNDSLMQIAAALGKDEFCDYQNRFGFGHKTGVDLPGEASADGLLYTPDTMDDASLATNSFGQNFNVTMMQMVSGFSALINGGYYYKPHVVKQIVNSDGAIVQNSEKTLVKQVASSDTSEFLRNALFQTVVAGTGKTAAVAGYDVAGKTGTAQISGKKDDNVYILSFMGYAPYDDPKVLCYVLVDQPDVPDTSSSSYASRLFSEIMTEVLPYMGVYSQNDAAPAPQQPVETSAAQPEPETTTAQPETTAPVDESYDDGVYGETPASNEPEQSAGN